MIVQYLSDTHLEFYTLSQLTRWLRWIPVRAPVLVLAGDIGNPFKITYETFLHWTSRRFEHVIVVLGNHEFYSDHPPSVVEEKARSICATFTNVHLLTRSTFDLPGTNLRFVGTTLWAPNGQCDIGRIPTWTTDMVQSIHASDAEWLAEEIERSNEHQLVVVTHHIPSASLVHPKYRMFDSSDFACECDHLFKSPVRAWIYGHTHTPSVHVRGGVYCVTNPIGYPGENVRFDAGTTIEL